MVLVLVDLDVYGIFCGPLRGYFCFLFPFFVEFCGLVEKLGLGIPAGADGVGNVVESTQIILFFLEVDFCQILSPDEIDAFIAGVVVFWRFFAGQNIHIGVGDPG